MDECKYYNVDLTSDFYVMNASLTRILALDAEDAEDKALGLMADSKYWRVVGVDRV